MEANDILDPAHMDDGGISAGAAGIPPPETTTDTLSEDGNILTRGDKTYITKAALDAERATNKGLRETLAQLDPVMPEFEEFLKVRGNRRETTSRTVAGTSTTQDDKTYLEEVAVALGYFDETNQPDLRRAQAHLNVTRTEAARETARQVRPEQERNVRDRAANNREAARGKKFTDGKPIADQKYVDAAMSSLPDEYLADPNIANITQVIAAGLEYLDMRRNGTLNRGGRSVQRGERNEPMFVEGSRGRFDGDGSELSGLDLAAARARGKSPEQWAKLAKSANGSVLEEV